MARRKLLLVTYHFPPSAASATFRMLGFVRHLPKFGWDPVVVAPPRGLWEPVDEGLLGQVPAGLPVYRVPHPRWCTARMVRRISREAPWILPGLAACGKAIRAYHPCAVLTTSPPHSANVLGWMLKQLHRLPWVADFRDPWIATTRRETDGAFATRVERFLESRVLRGADVVIANAPNASAGLRAAYPDCREKIVTLTNGYDPEPFGSLERAKANGELHLLHAGEIYCGRDPRPLLDAVRNLVRGPSLGVKVKVTFLGETTDPRCDLRAEVAQRQIGGTVIVQPQCGYSEALERMAAADILLVLDSPGRRVGVPAKIYEYLGAGRPVFALAEQDGDTAWVLRESGTLHRTAPADQSARIEQSLRELIALVQEAPSPAARTATAFTRENLAHQLAGVLDTCLTPAPVRPVQAWALQGEGPAR